MSADESGYVPPDHTTTVEFARPAAPAETPPPTSTPPPAPTAPRAPVTPPLRMRLPPIAIALITAVSVMLVTLGATLLISGRTDDEATASRPSAKKPPGKAAAPSAPAKGKPVPVGSVVDGDGITYRIVQRDEGYYEGLFVITNRTGRPMDTWRVSFEAPGANVRNVWDGRLVQGGAHPVIENAEGADPIPPGGTLDVQYGAVGAPAMPGHCLFNGAACGLRPAY